MFFHHYLYYHPVLYKRFLGVIILLLRDCQCMLKSVMPYDTPLNSNSNQSKLRELNK